MYRDDDDELECSCISCDRLYMWRASVIDDDIDIVDYGMRVLVMLCHLARPVTGYLFAVDLHQ